MLIEKARRLAHDYRNFDNYRLRMLLAVSGTRRRIHELVGGAAAQAGRDSGAGAAVPPC